MKKEDSLNKRYLFKLLTNIIGLPIQLIIQSIVPRSLGPIVYGKFNFLTQTFTQVTNFLDSGTSFAYYTRLSKDLNNKGIVKYYFGLIFKVIVILILIITSTILLKINNKIWPDIEIKYIYMVLFWAILTLLANIVSKTVDAFGFTKNGEVIKITQKLVALTIILSLYFLWQINLTIFFIYHYFIIALIIVGWVVVLKKKNINILYLPKLKKDFKKELNKYFWKYSNPLVIYLLLGMVFGFLDLWLLQKYSGSLQQGYFGLSYKISSICFLFTGALTPLLTREFSIAFHGSDILKMRKLFNDYIPILYAIAAILSVFIAVEASSVATIFGGGSFKEASLSISIMALYPIHQTYGQLNGSIFYATNRTKLYRNIGIVMMSIGLILTIILIIPFFSLNLKAFGLALKMVIIQFIWVNVQLYFNSKLISLDFKKQIINQIKVVLFFLFVAFLSRYLSGLVSNNSTFSFFLSGVIYTFLVIISIYIKPNLISVSEEKKNLFIKMIKYYMLKMKDND